MKLITISRLHKTQPNDLKKKVIELKIGGKLGLSFVNRSWAGYTWPLPFLCLILYWVSADFPNEDSLARVHEFTHVKQDSDNLCFAVTWFNYFKALIVGRFKYGSWMMSYMHNPMEVEAYAVEQQAFDLGLPAWAKD